MNTVAVPLVVLLIFSVADAVRICDRFTNELTRGTRSLWPEGTMQRFKDEMGVESDEICHWIDIAFIAEWTRLIGGIFYAPFIVLAVLIFARSSIFDDWSNPIGLVVVFGLSFLYAIMCAAVLWRAASRARSAALERLTTALIRAKGAGGVLASQVEIMIERVRGLQEGAFAPVAQQPLVRALLVPLSGASGASILEYFM